MKLIDTAEAGKILGVHYNRIKSLIKQGHLKDYNPVVEGRKKHYSKVSVTEVREFKKNFKIEYRTVTPKMPRAFINGHSVRVQSVNARPSLNDQTIPTPPTYLPIKVREEQNYYLHNKAMDYTADALDAIEELIRALEKLK